MALQSFACYALALLPAEALVFPGFRILDRLEVSEHMRAGQGGRHLVLQLIAEVVACLHAPMTRHEHVERHEATGTSHASAQRMELDLVCFTAGQQIFENLLLGIGKGAIQQAGGGFVKQLPAVAARKDVTLWKRFMPPLPRLLGGLFAGLLMVHLSIPNQVVSSNTLIFSSIFDLPKGAVYK